MSESSVLKQEGVDEFGYILTVGHQPIQPVFQALVANVLTTLTSQFPNLIHSIYLYGSVARGDAVAGRSDLDLTLVLHQIASPDESRQLESIRRTLQVAHPEVVKIDVDIGVLTNVTAASNMNSWGFWLKHHCRCMWGDDLATRFDPFKPSRAIALAVNGDFYEAMDGYAEKIEAATNHTEIQYLKRAAARKLIRASNILRPENDRSWPQNLDDYAALFLMSYPSMRSGVDYFLAEAKGVNGVSDDFVARLRELSSWFRMRI
jgi:uncharacterized protein